MKFHEIVRDIILPIMSLTVAILMVGVGAMLFVHNEIMAGVVALTLAGVSAFFVAMDVKRLLKMNKS